MTVTMNIVGAGNLGKTIGKLMVLNKLVKIESVCNTTKNSTLAAINFMGDGTYCSSISELTEADLILIATPDDLISQTCYELSQNQNLRKNSTVFHCSGSLTSEVLTPAKNVGCKIASIHPMRSFADPALSSEHFIGTYCAMEGDLESLSILENIFKAFGAITYNIEKTKKTVYHAAGVIASNYLITLANQALACLNEAGVEKHIAINIISNLMKGSVANLEKTLSPSLALTGPIKRGDIATIEKHINALNGERKELYNVLGKATIPLTTLNSSKKKELSHIFDQTEKIETCFFKTKKL